MLPLKGVRDRTDTNEAPEKVPLSGIVKETPELRSLLAIRLPTGQQHLAPKAFVWSLPI
jgi:hypothetical protein